MSKKILFGIDERLNNLENLKLYAGVLDVALEDKLLGVYLSDYLKHEETHSSESLSIAAIETDNLKRFTISLEMEAVAERLRIDYGLFEGESLNENFLIRQSSFTDLLMVDGIFVDDFCTVDKPTSLRLLSLMECPVLVNPATISKVQDIVVLFDGRKSSIKAIKSFVELFKLRLGEKPITILSVSPQSDEEIEQEKYLINYMISNMKNVGIQVTDDEEMVKDLEKQLRSSEMPMLILGTAGIDLICTQEVFKEIRNNHIPVFFAN